MQEIPPETAEAIAAERAAVPIRTRGSRRWLRLGIGSRLALGLAAVSAVIVWGHILAARTTRIAIAPARSIKTEHDRRAKGASAVVESLVTYDRSVTEYLQSG